jgi:membrane protein insertase Oxa1/YidC/SpoIIIJ
VDLTRKAVGPLYWPALLIAFASAIAQYLQSKQLMPQAQDSRSLKQILSEAGKGRTADQQEVNAAVGRSTMIFIPALVFLFALQLPAALPLYWLTSSTVAYWQQSIILRDDASDADKSVKVTTKNETSAKSKNKKPSSTKKKPTAKRKKK